MNNNDISQSKPEEPNTNMPEQKDIVNSSLEPKKKKEKKKKKKKKNSYKSLMKEIMKPKSSEEERKQWREKQLGEKISFTKVDKI